MFIEQKIPYVNTMVGECIKKTVKFQKNDHQKQVCVRYTLPNLISKERGRYRLVKLLLMIDVFGN